MDDAVDGGRRATLAKANVRFYASFMRLVVQLDREADGRWIAEVADLPGVLAYGATEAEAVGRVRSLALRVLADLLEHGEVPAFDSLEFAAA